MKGVRNDCNNEDQITDGSIIPPISVAVLFFWKSVLDSFFSALGTFVLLTIGFSASGFDTALERKMTFPDYEQVVDGQLLQTY